jgi:hypothetical protein
MPELESSPSAVPDPWSSLWGHTDRPAWDLAGADPIARALREHWEVQSAWITERARILDVGSGPAVLARWLQASRQVRNGEPNASQWICVDQARIDPSCLSDLPFVQGMFGQAWEAMPAPETGADALVSNFGLEYVPRGHLVRTCAAWLAEGGRLHAVMHARGSFIDERSAQGLADLDLILEQLGLPERVAALLEAKVGAPSDPLARLKHGVDIRDAFNECANHMKARLEERGTREGVLLEWLVLARDLVQAVSKETLGASLDRLQALRVAYGAERSRLAAMQSAALDESGLEEIGRELTSQGFMSVQTGRLQVSAGPVAWILDARRSTGSR